MFIFILTLCIFNQLGASDELCRQGITFFNWKGAELGHFPANNIALCYSIISNNVGSRLVLEIGNAALGKQDVMSVKPSPLYYIGLILANDSLIITTY